MACTVSLRRIFYKLRVMPIILVDWSAVREQLRMMTLRDLKSPQYSMGLRQSRSRCPKRYDVLLLIAEIMLWCCGVVVLWCIGLTAQHLGWQRYFQANTVRKRTVLSIVRLGKEVRKRDKYPVKETIFRWALIEYINLVHDTGRSQL